jgi:2-C-methyl-D-erythritol 4-phosphate cytidylyltransferase
MKKKLFAIIVAGGSGNRMQSTQPKQFLKLMGLPILMHTINAYIKAVPSIEIILVLPGNHFSFWKSLCDEHNYSVPHLLVEGGETRGQSVLNGLEKIGDDGIVAIHDGVRPFVSERMIRESFKMAESKGSAIAAVDLKDSIRIVTEMGSHAVDRNQYKIIQTPQVFRTDIIRESYQKVGNLNLSDDATIAELAGFEIYLVEGSYDNIKITTPEDLMVAEKIAERLKL